MQSTLFNYDQIMKEEIFGMKKYQDAVYRGQLLNGKRDGFGVMVYRKNRVYEGQWAHDYREGKGMEKYSNGNKYEGDFKNEKLTVKVSITGPTEKSTTVNGKTE